MFFLDYLNNNLLSTVLEPIESHSFNKAKVIFLKIKLWAFHLLLIDFQCLLITLRSNPSVWHSSPPHDGPEVP